MKKEFKELYEKENKKVNKIVKMLNDDLELMKTMQDFADDPTRFEETIKYIKTTLKKIEVINNE